MSLLHCHLCFHWDVHKTFYILTSCKSCIVFHILLFLLRIHTFQNWLLNFIYWLHLTLTPYFLLLLIYLILYFSAVHCVCLTNSALSFVCTCKFLTHCYIYMNKELHHSLSTTTHFLMHTCILNGENYFHVRYLYTVAFEMTL